MGIPTFKLFIGFFLGILFSASIYFLGDIRFPALYLNLPEKAEVDAEGYFSFSFETNVPLEGKRLYIPNLPDGEVIFSATSNPFLYEGKARAKQGLSGLQEVQLILLGDEYKLKSDNLFVYYERPLKPSHVVSVNFSIPAPRVLFLRGESPLLGMEVAFKDGTVSKIPISEFSFEYLDSLGDPVSGILLTSDGRLVYKDSGVYFIRASYGDLSTTLQVVTTKKSFGYEDFN